MKTDEDGCGIDASRRDDEIPSVCARGYTVFDEEASRHVWRLMPALLRSKQRRPVDNDCDRTNAGLLFEDIDEKPLAVSGHVVNGPALIDGQRGEVEQRPRGTDIHTVR